MRIRIGAFAVAFATWVCKGSSRRNSQKIDSFIRQVSEWTRAGVSGHAGCSHRCSNLWIYTMLPAWYSALSPFPSYLRKALRPNHQIKMLSEQLFNSSRKVKGYRARGKHSLGDGLFFFMGLVLRFLAFFSSCPAWIHKVREVGWLSLLSQSVSERLPRGKLIYAYQVVQA